MTAIVKVKAMGLSKLNNAEYTNFSTRFSTLVTTATAEALGIAAADLAAYTASLATMNDIVAQSRTSDLTAEMSETDKELDALIVYLMSSIRTAKGSPLAAQKTAGTSLYNVTKPYTGCQNLPNQQETAAVTGLITDLRKTENAAHVSALGLTEVVAGMETTNQRYAVLTAERTSEKAASQLDETKVVRALMDGLYDTMTTLAFVQSVSKPTDITAGFITNVNALIDEVNGLYNQRTAQAKRKPVVEK